MAWTTARCTLSLKGDVRRLEGTGGMHLRLERGSVRFGVDPRRPGESFAVEFGSCRATVVGTAFTLRVDSAQDWAGVEHGKVRVETGSGTVRFLTRGQSWSCRDPQASSAGKVPVETPRPAVAAVVPTAPSPEESRWAQLWEGCKVPSERCTDGLADYLRTHPVGARSARAALLWADRAQQAGDLRDALYALDLAAHAQAGEASFGARLRMISLKAKELRQAEAALRELDALIGTLPEGAARDQGLSLREELSREKSAAPARTDLP